MYMLDFDAKGGFSGNVDAIAGNEAMQNLIGDPGFLELFLTAQKYHQTRFIQSLVRSYARTGHENTALHWLTRGEDMDHALIAPMLEAGADIEAHNNAGLTPLHSFANKGWADGVRCLLEAGADAHALSHGENNALTLSILNQKLQSRQGDRIKILKMLLDLKVAHDAGLMVAASNDVHDVVKVMHKRGLTYTDSDVVDASILSLASSYNSHNACYALVKAGADVTEVFSNGDTALIRLCRGVLTSFPLDYLDALILGGSDPYFQDASGKSAIDHLSANANRSVHLNRIDQLMRKRTAEDVDANFEFSKKPRLRGGRCL